MSGKAKRNKGGPPLPSFSSRKRHPLFVRRFDLDHSINRVKKDLEPRDFVHLLHAHSWCRVNVNTEVGGARAQLVSRTRFIAELSRRARVLWRNHAIENYFNRNRSLPTYRVTFRDYDIYISYMGSMIDSRNNNGLQWRISSDDRGKNHSYCKRKKK